MDDELIEFIGGLIAVVVTIILFVWLFTVIFSDPNDNKYKNQYSNMPDIIEIKVDTKNLSNKDMYGAIEKATERFPEFGTVTGTPKEDSSDSEGNKIYIIQIKKDKKWPSNNMKTITIEEDDKDIK
jgi:hypothetical protein